MTVAEKVRAMPTARATAPDGAEPVVSGKAGIAIAMAAAFAEIEGATKSATNPHFKSKYADLGAVIDAIKPALINHGLFFTQRPEPANDGVQIETVLHHASGEEMSLGKLFVPANKRDAQAFGSALTYARRYALVTAFGVPVEDDDGNAAARAQSAPRNDEMPDAEWAKLVQLREASQTNVPALLKHLNINLPNNNLRLLDQDQYARVIDAMEGKLAAMVKANDDARAKDTA